MGKVASLGKIKSHESIAGLQTCHHHSHVSLCSGMRLHIGIFSLEKLAETVNGKLLYPVHHLASSIISCTRIPLSIFIGTYRPQRRKDLIADIILRCYQFDAVSLPFFLFFDKIENLKIVFHIY